MSKQLQQHEEGQKMKPLVKLIKIPVLTMVFDFVGWDFDSANPFWRRATLESKPLALLEKTYQYVWIGLVGVYARAGRRRPGRQNVKVR